MKKGSQKNQKSKKNDDLHEVCILLITKDEKIITEPSLSESLGKILKPLSVKFSLSDCSPWEAVEKLLKKYCLKGINNHAEKIELEGNFNLEDKRFFVFSLKRDGKSKVQLSGNFQLIRRSDVKNNFKVPIKGNGFCNITDSFKQSVDLLH